MEPYLRHHLRVMINNNFMWLIAFTKTESIDLLDKNICICCNQGGGVLVCSQIACPVALHVNCLDSEPKFDDFGYFYCPYCWYKLAVDKCQELREKAMTTKKTLSSFLDKNGGSKMKEVVVGDGDNRHDATKGRVKRKLPETAYPQKVAPVKKPLLQEHSSAEKNASDINEEVTSSRTLRQPHTSPNYVCSRT